MKNLGTYRWLLAGIMIATLGSASAQAGVVETHVSTSGDTTSSQTAYDNQITNNDLIDKHSPTFLSIANSGTTNNGACDFTKFNDGIASTKISTNDLSGDAFFTGLGDLSVAPSVTFNLNLKDHPDGYDISEIKTINGWADSQTFSNQHYTVSYRAVNSNIFEPVHAVNYIPFAKDEPKNPQNASMVTLKVSEGALMTNAAAIRFTYGLPTVASAGAVVREIEVTGQPSTKSASPAPPVVTTILPIGDSITWGDQDIDGVTAGHGNTPIPSGYRTALYKKLHAANFAFHFVGSQTTNPSKTLTEANEVNNEGHNGYQIHHLTENLTASSGTGGNNGGYWLSGGGNTGRDAVYPNIILLAIGTNDISAHKSAATIEGDLKTLVDTLIKLRPDATIMVGSIIPKRSDSENMVIAEYNTYIEKTLVPDEKTQGHHVLFVDQHKNFLNADQSPNPALRPDGSHPSQAGYDLMGESWARAILARGK